MILIDAFLHKKTRGIGVFVREALFSLQDHHPGLEWLAIANSPIRGISPEKQRTIRWCFGQAGWEQLLVPFIAKKVGACTVHFPGNSFSIRSTGPRKVVTLHDLMFLDRSLSSMRLKLGNSYRKACFQFLRNSVVTSVSSSSQEAIESAIGRSVILTPNSCGYLKPKAGGSFSTRRGDSKRKYFVHVGGLAQNKNTKRVIEAFLLATLAKDIKLVVLGDTESAFRQFLGDTCRNDRLSFPGWLPSEEIHQVVAGALAVVFPSLREGFGLPIVEAAALGVPVVTSNYRPMAELMPESSVLVDPTSTQEITFAIERIASDSLLRSSLSRHQELAHERYGRQSLASGLVSAYRLACGNK